MKLDIQIIKGSKTIRHKSDADIKSAKEWLYHTKQRLTDFDYIAIEVYQVVFTTRGNKEYMPFKDTEVYTFREAEEWIDGLGISVY